MSSISATVATADIKAVSKSAVRSLSLDRARTFLTLVVLLHHSVIPYTYYGHTDPKEFFGFDMIVLATDSFFMAMFFFLSGLFVWPGHREKGHRQLSDGPPASAGPALCDLRIHGHSARLLRNFAAATSRNRLFRILVDHDHERPVAERTDLVSLGPAHFRRAGLHPVSAVAQRMLDPINRLSLHGRRRPAVFFAVMLAVTAAFYVPGRIHYGAGSWFEFGPFSVQHGRVLLYATYFFFGAGIGLRNLDRGLLAADGRMAKVSWDWMMLAIVPYYLMWVLISIKRDNPGKSGGSAGLV